MKKSVLTALITFLIAVPSYGQTSVIAGGEMLAPTSESPSNLINLYPTHQFSNRWGVWGFAGITPKWAEALAGPLYSRSFADGSGFAQFGVGVGVEQSDFTPRFATSAFLQYKNLAAFGWFEYSRASGRWHKFTLMYQLKNWKIGVMSQGFRGQGPRFEWTIRDSPVTVWGAYVKSGSWRPLIGVTISL
jgi:hypothetical protein